MSVSLGCLSLATTAKYQSSIGNAKIEGMYEDLRLTDTEYNLCLTVFFFTYALFEVPSNMMLKKFRPSIWLPSIMVAWGTVVCDILQLYLLY